MPRVRLIYLPGRRERRRMRGKPNIFFSFFSPSNKKISSGAGGTNGSRKKLSNKGRMGGLYTDLLLLLVERRVEREREREQAVDICKQRVDYDDDARAAANSTTPRGLLYITRPEESEGEYVLAIWRIFFSPLLCCHQLGVRGIAPKFGAILIKSSSNSTRESSISFLIPTQSTGFNLLLKLSSELL